MTDNTYNKVAGALDESRALLAEVMAALTAAAERERVLREALQYYADGNGPLESDHTTDYGARARAALEATK